MTELNREVFSPLRREDLAPLPPECPGVVLRSEFTPAEYRELAALLEAHPEKKLSAWPRSLEFLQYFPSLRGFSCSTRLLDSLDGLQLLRDCRFLYLHHPAATLSLSPIAEMPSLETLLIDGEYSNHSALALLTSLRTLTLIHAAKLQTLEWLPPNLVDFSMNVGSIRDISGLTRFPNIAEISFHKTRLLADLSPLGSVTGLQKLHLSQLSSVTELFDFSGLQQLRDLRIVTLRKLTDTRPLLAARSLVDLFLYDLPALDPQSWHDTCQGWLDQGKPPFWEMD